MPEEMNWKKFLTENVLGECWDADKRSDGDLTNRTFDSRKDMMDLYEVIQKSEKWDNFLVFLWPIYLDKSKYLLNANTRTARMIFVAWLFCLGNKDYESRCITVAKFLNGRKRNEQSVR